VLSAISRGGVEVSAAVEPPTCVFAARAPRAARAGALRKIERPAPPPPRGPSGDRAVARGLVSRSCSVGSAVLTTLLRLCANVHSRQRGEVTGVVHSGTTPAPAR